MPTPAARRQGLDETADEQLEAAIGELDRGERRRHAVDPGRTTGAGPGATGPTRGADGEQPGVREPVEPRTCDVAVDVLGRGEVVDGDGIPARARKQERASQSGVANCVQLVHLYL